jgi:hypothetical protein
MLKKHPTIKYCKNTPCLVDLSSNVNFIIKVPPKTERHSPNTNLSVERPILPFHRWKDLQIGIKKFIPVKKYLIGRSVMLAYLLL